MTASHGDCTLGGGEDGTGLLNTATVQSNGLQADSSACGPVGVPEPPVDDPTTTTVPIGQLPRTGSQLVGLALTGLVLLLAGLALRGGAQRRRPGASA